MTQKKQREYGAVLEQVGFVPCATPAGFPQEGPAGQQTRAEEGGIIGFIPPPRATA